MSSPEPASTTGNIKYYVPPADGIRAYQHINVDSTTGERKRNFTLEDKDIIVENLRGKEDSVTLDTAGFQFYRRPAKHTSFIDDAEIQREYYPESVELLKELTGASRVVFFDHSKPELHHSPNHIISLKSVISHSQTPTRPGGR